MMLLTKAHRKELLANHESQREMLAATEGGCEDLKPVVKLFDAFGSAFWLLTEMDEDGIAYGLCDLGLGFPEVGSVSLAELESLEFMPGCPRVERDQWFTAEKTLWEYAQAAKEGVRP